MSIKTGFGTTVKFNERGWMKPTTEEKPKKEPKQKKVKEPKVKEPKPEPEPEPELTPSEYVETILDDKLKQIKFKMIEIENLQKIINSLKLKSDDEIILNERRAIIRRIMSKLPKNDKFKEEKEEMFKNLSKDIKKFDEHFNITSDKLSSCDLKF